MKVSQFDAKMLEAWRVANERPIILSHMPRKDAIAFRMRMNWLRRCMREEDHHYLPFAECVSIYFHEHEDDTITVTIAASHTTDTKYGKLLESAGVGDPELPSIEDAAHLEPTNPDAQSALDKWMEEDDT